MNMTVETRSEWLWPVCRLAGLLPMTTAQCRCPAGVSWPKACACRPLLPSPFWLVYSLALAAVLVAWPASNLVRFKTPDYEAREIVLGMRNESATPHLTSHLVGSFDVVSIAVIAVASIVQGAVAHDLVLRLITQLRKVDLLLQYVSRGVSRWLLIFLSGLLSVMLLDAVYKACHDTEFAVRTVPTYASYLITFIREIMFVDDVNRLNARFVTINADLQVCLAPEYTRGKAASNAGRAIAAERQRARIARLATAFDMLCQSVDLVGRQYSLFLLCDMVGLLVRLVVTTYFIIGMVLEAQEVRVFTTNVTMYLFVQTLWLLSHLVRIFVLVAPCSTTMEATDRTGNIVSCSLGRDMQDGQLYQQLKSLSIHLLHRRIGFSAFGVFNLNLPLVCTVMSAVTTYLVVLIQLQFPGADARAR